MVLNLFCLHLWVYFNVIRLLQNNTQWLYENIKKYIESKKRLNRLKVVKRGLYNGIKILYRSIRLR